MAKNTSTKRRLVTIHPPVRLVGEPKKTKKKRRKKHQNSGKVAIRPDHPRRLIKAKFCMVGGLWCAAIHIKYHPNRLRGYGAVRVENNPFPLLWPVAYTSRDKDRVRYWIFSGTWARTPPNFAIDRRYCMYNRRTPVRVACTRQRRLWCRNCHHKPCPIDRCTVPLDVRTS